MTAVTRTVSLAFAVAALSCGCAADPSSDADEDGVSTAAGPPVQAGDVRAPDDPWSRDLVTAASGATAESTMTMTPASDAPLQTKRWTSPPARDVDCSSPWLCVEAEHRPPVPR
jgi:hypothetical protein